MPTKAAVTVTPVTAMTVAMATVHAVSAMAMSATVTTVTTRRSGSNGSSGQSERGGGCESDFAKHTLYSPFARRDCLMRSSDAADAKIVRNIFLNRYSGNACKHWISWILRRSGVSWITDQITQACGHQEMQLL